MDMTRTLCAAAIASFGALLPAHSAIVGAVGGVINSGGPGFGTLTETYNQAGLSANYVSGVTNFDTFVATTTHTIVFAGYEWFSNSGTSAASVTYDLGAKLLIDKMALWNEESSGIGLLDLLVSDDGISFTSLLSGLLPTDNPLADYKADVFGFAATAFQYIRLDMSGCPQPIVGSFPACAIGEVAFNKVSTVPVPAGGLLLLAGLGGLGVLRRRKTV
jgi:hypothetical protein